MKKLIKILFFLLTFALVFSFVSCGGGECKHVDADGDYICDKCEEELEKPEEPETKLSLVTDGTVNFQVVYAKTVSTDARQAVNDAIIKPLKKQNLTVKFVTEGSKEDVVQDCEILVGDITTRGEKYRTKGHDYGKDGYVIKIVDSKVIINAGSSSSIVDAIGIFAENVFAIDTDEPDFTNVVMSSTQNKEVIQTDYKITSITVAGNNVKDYTIATDTKASAYSDAAEDLQYMLYDRAGLWLEIVDLSKATDKSIVIKHIDKVYTDDSFKIYATAGGQLVVECAFDNMLTETLSEFLTDKITLAEGDVSFSGEIFKKDISTVYYADFGAKGDGKTDDFEAIYNAHVFANEGGQRVMADETKTYYIHMSRIKDPATSKYVVTHIPIKTDVVWGKAKFTINDYDLDPYNTVFAGMRAKNVFIAESDYKTQTIGGSDKNSWSATDKAVIENIMNSGGIKPGTSKIDIGYAQGDFPVMIVPHNNSHKVYRRYGPYTPASDAMMQEVIVLDKEGNVDPTTPIMFTYTDIQYIEVYRIDVEPITIDGGIFTTIAYGLDAVPNDGEHAGIDIGYFHRGLQISRPNTVVKNVEHYMEGEIGIREQAIDDIQGPAYNGFYNATNTHNVLFKDCVMTGRRKYTHGTYELSGALTNKLVFDGCIQSNFWITVDPENGYKITGVPEGTPGAMTSQWTGYEVEGTYLQYLHYGAGGTNFCKNMEYYSCRLSRFDAHQGLYNGKIIDCEINAIYLTGKGHMDIINTRLFSNYPSGTHATMISLRGDYGATWEGDILFKDCDAYMYSEKTDSYTDQGGYSTPTVLGYSWRNWYFGYTTYAPSIEIDNLDVFNIKKIQPKGERKVGDPISPEILLAEKMDPGFEILITGINAKEHRAIHLDNVQVAGMGGAYQIMDLDENGKYYDLSNDTQRAKYEALLKKYESLSEEEKANYKGVDGLVDAPYVGFYKDAPEERNLIINGEYVDYIDAFDAAHEARLVWEETNGKSWTYYMYTYDGDLTNLNPRTPPEFIKVYNNDGVEGTGGYTLTISKTHGDNVSSGGYYGIQNNGGFFGSTTFYYKDENGTVQSFVGTFENKGPFVFK